MAQSNEEWLEEDLCKMSYKELQKIAIKRNINSKLKKAQLMSALLTTGCDKTVDSHVNVTGRVTRSRAALRPLNTMDERTCPKSDTNGLNILSATGDSEKVTTQRQSRKKKTTIIVNSCEEASNKESLEKCGKSTDTHIAGVGNKEETQEGLQKESSQTIDEAENRPVSNLPRSSTFVLDDQESSQTIDEAENRPVSNLPRSSTFVLDDQESSTTVSEMENMPVPTLLRSSTFVLDDQGVEDNAISKTVLKEKKIIGGRLSSKNISEGKKISSSLGRKKNATGSILKNYSGATRKAPNFKAIHKRLFDNMESLSDNKERKLARAASFMQSPTPQCAILSPRFRPMKNEPKINSSLKTGIPIKIRGSASVQSTAKASTTLGNLNNNNGLNPRQSSSVLDRKRTKLPPGKLSNIVNSASTNNLRFSSRQSSSDLDRERAKTAISTKLPPVNLERRDKDRAIIQGVRTNKRFLLQMEMRRKNQ